MSLFTSVELLIMGSVLGGLLLIIFVLLISELVSRKDKILEIEDLEEVEIQEIVRLEEIGEKQEFVSYDIKKEVEEIALPSSKEEIVYEDVKVIEPEKEEIEVIDIIESEVNVVKIESELDSLLDAREKAQIELLKVEEELEHTPSLEDTITNLEAIEEENAIISYQELLSNTNELNVVSCDDGDEPITISEVFKMFNEESSNEIEFKEEITNLPLEDAYQGNFLETPYLSPVNGIECENLAEIQLENTANLEKLEKEIRKTNEFLNILNELKKNLE